MAALGGKHAFCIADGIPRADKSRYALPINEIKIRPTNWHSIFYCDGMRTVQIALLLFLLSCSLSFGQPKLGGWFSDLEHCTLVNRAILKAFNGEDVKFAFPTQTIALGKADDGTT